LKGNEYVRRIFTEYLRAFDIINHARDSHSETNVFSHASYNVMKWIVNFLPGRTWAIFSYGKLSS
jgi:hypothetical protein